MERVQHTITAYARIKQPEQWAQWVRNQADVFDQGTITNIQAFMNSAVLRYNKISGASEGGFSGASTTLQEDIVAMVAAVKRPKPNLKPNPAAVANKPKPKPAADAKPRKMPPFVKHFKSDTASDSKPYKVGDTKTWDNTLWYFCDCPNHRERVKWHTHPATDCRTRLKWLENQGTVQGKVADLDDDTTDADPSEPPAADITGLLASAMNMVGDNSVAHDLIADALNAIHHG
jgi:hypothetical protein